MYSIDYDHASKRLDVFTIFDLSKYPLERKDGIERYMKVLVEQMFSPALNNNQLFGSISIYGHGKVWIKKQNDLFDNDYIRDQLFIDHDQFLTIDAMDMYYDAIYVGSTHGTWSTDEEFEDFSGHGVVAFTMNVDKAEHRVSKANLLVSDHHVSGTF